MTHSLEPFRKYGLDALLLVCCCMLFSSCSDNSPITIACIGAHSWKQSEAGIGVRNAVMLRVKEINDQGGLDGHPVKLVLVDNEGKPERCRQQLVELHDSGVRFFIGPVFSKMAQATLTALEGRDALAVSPTMSTDILAGHDDNLLRLTPNNTQQAEILAGFVIEKELTPTAVVYDLNNRTYTEPLYLAFKDAIEQAGLSLGMTVSINSQEESDMLGLANDIVASGARSLLMCLSARDASHLAQQLSKQEHPLQMLGVSWTQTDDLLQHGGRSLEDMVLVSVLKNQDPSPAMINFQKAYQDAYGIPPTNAAIRGYDCITMFLDAMLAAEEITPQGVKQAMLDLSPYQGLDSEIILDQYGDLVGTYALVRIEDNSYRIIE